MRIQAGWGVAPICLAMLALGCSHPSVDCPKAFKTCGNICVDTATDVANCGACGTACAAGQVCSAGTCATTCQSGLTACGGSCRDLQTDAAHCGTCGTACGPGQSCIAGACGCLPGMACGPTVLVYYDVTGLGGTKDSPAVGAVAALKGSVISTKTDAAFAAAYDAGGFDMIVYDAPGGGATPNAPVRLTDWVCSGGRLAHTAWVSSMQGWGNTLFGVTSLGYNPLRPLYDEPASAAKLFSGFTTFPSPLTPTPGTPVFATANGVELTPAAGAGFLAGHLDSATGPGGIAVTNGNQVVLNGFLPINYRGVDNNANGVEDIQELFENEIVYLARQPTTVPYCTFESFDVGTWPITPPWTLAATGAAYGSTTAACAHDGANGFSPAGGGSGLADWYFRTDVVAGYPGQKLSAWFQTQATGSNRFYLGAGATSAGALALTAAPNTSELMFQTIATNYTVYTVSGTSAPFTYAPSTWYRLEIQFGVAGAVTGSLFATDGTTLLATTSTTGATAGGIGFRTYGSFCLDTIRASH